MLLLLYMYKIIYYCFLIYICLLYMYVLYKFNLTLALVGTHCLYGIVIATWETTSTRLLFLSGIALLSRLASLYLLPASRSYKHLYHQVTGSASVLLNLRSSNEYGRVVSDPIEGAPYDERPLLVLRNAAGA